MRRLDEPIFMFHRALVMAKSANEHGIILNYDDMQMGRAHAIHLLLTIPQSTHYPIVDTITPKMKEEMLELGFIDFWDYYFNAEKVRVQKKKEKLEQEKQKNKKRHSLF